MGDNKKDDKPEKEEGKKQIEELFQYIQEGDKIELTVGNSTNLMGGNTLKVYNTQSGLRATATPNIQSFGGNESSYQSGFNQGYIIGKEAGRNEAENKSILEKLKVLEEGGGKKGFDLEAVATNLSGSETGQQILMAIMKKLGMMPTE